MDVKQQLRRTARETRKALLHPDFAHAIARHAQDLPIPKGAIVGGYHALPDEADPQLLLERLVEAGHHIAFPRVAAKDQPLDFHRVPDDGVLAPGAFGIHEPLATWPRVTPAVLLVPLLAFDDSGHRLGYGGGFYDRLLPLLRTDISRAAAAFELQMVDCVPRGKHDLAIDLIITETAAHAASLQRKESSS